MDVRVGPTIKKAECQRTDAFELWCWKRLLDCKEIKPVNSKGNQSWIFMGGTDAEAEIPILWPPDVKNWLIAKDSDAGEDWRQEEKGVIEDEMAWCHNQLDGPEFEQALGIGDGQGSLVCCSPWGCKKQGTTERLKWSDWNYGGQSLRRPQWFCFWCSYSCVSPSPQTCKCDLVACF